SRNPPSPLRNIASATAWSAFTAATALSSIARASWGELPCCANAAVESARADTAPIISVRNIGILSCLVWAASGSRAVRLYFALPRLPDLSDSAKDLFVAAMDGKGPDHYKPGQVKQSGIGGYSALPALHQLRRDCRAERFLVALTPAGDLFISAKDLFVEANGPHSAIATSFHSDRARPGRSEQSVLSFIAS